MWRFPPVIIHFRFSDFHFPMEINRVSLGLPDLRHAATTSWKSMAVYNIHVTMMGLYRDYMVIIPIIVVIKCQSLEFSHGYCVIPP